MAMIPVMKFLLGSCLFLGVYSGAFAEVEKSDVISMARQMYEKGLIPKKDFELIETKINSLTEDQLRSINSLSKVHGQKIKNGDQPVSNDLDSAAKHIDTNSQTFKEMSESLKMIFDDSNPQTQVSP